MVLAFATLQGRTQTAEEREKVFTTMQPYIISIGTTIIDTIVEKGRKKSVIRYISVGSGLITYVPHNGLKTIAIITAAHVTDFFKKKGLTSLMIRPQTADTLKTTDYFGEEIPLNNIIRYPDSLVDLSCILAADTFLLGKNFDLDNIKLFPINSLSVPYLGDQVWIGGYPSHVENNFQKDFYYNIATLKPGYIAWKPSATQKNPQLNHITLVESNATFGNSGGPVFWSNWAPINDSIVESNIYLAGIMVAIYEETETVFAGDRPAVDKGSNQTLVAKGRSGVSIIEKAEYVRKLIEFVIKKIKK